jgi:23S rRNA (uracil1939-C5)-methyltransferase
MPAGKEKANGFGTEKKIFTVKIEKLDDDLDGVAFRGGKKYVCRKVLPGETVEAEEERLSGKTVICKVLGIREKSADRIDSPCPYYGNCGGCNLLHTSYENQLAIKSALVRRKMTRFGFYNTDTCVRSDAVGARNKTHIVFFRKGDKVSAGFFNEETHKVVNVVECLCHGKWYADLREILVRWVKKNNITVYDPKTRVGLLRFAAARFIGGALSVTLIVTKNEIPAIEKLYEAIGEKFSSVGLFANVNSNISNEVMSGELIHLYGEDMLYSEICGVKFGLSPDAFFQMNSGIATQIYDRVLKEIGAATRVIDLFCGIGITSVMSAKAGKDVTAVEISPSAVRDAKELAQKNGVADKIDFLCGDTASFAAKIEKTRKYGGFCGPAARRTRRNGCKMAVFAVAGLYNLPFLQSSDSDFRPCRAFIVGRV